jgi:hypothetical protein
MTAKAGEKPRNINQLARHAQFNISNRPALSGPRAQVYPHTSAELHDRGTKAPYNNIDDMALGDASRCSRQVPRRFLSGTAGKEMGLTVTSLQGEDGEWRYSVKP